MKCKKQIIIGLVLTIAITLFSTTCMAKTAVVNVEALKLREKASTDSEILDVLNSGDELEIIEESGDWYKVKVSGKAGYVKGEYVKIQKDNEEIENTATETEKEENIEENTINNDETVKTNITPDDSSSNKQTKNEFEPKKVKIIKDANCYILPLINSSILSEIKKDSTVTINNEVNGWLYIETDETMGWILANSVDIAGEEENLEDDENEKTEEDNKKEKETEKNNDEKEVTKISERIMYVNSPSIYIRKGPATTYESIDSLVLNAPVTVIGEVDDWYQVKVAGETGYIAKRLLSKTETEESTSRNSGERDNQINQTVSNAPASTRGEEIVNYAKQYLNCPYVYGGSGPSSFDCSGFTMYVYKNFGVSLSHSATAQSRVGTYVSKEDLQPGDLVFFKDYQTMDGIGHVGIYVGNGQFIHASSGTGYCVKYSDLTTGSYANRYETARRII